jgi:hypothetical protein
MVTGFSSDGSLASKVPGNTFGTNVSATYEARGTGSSTHAAHASSALRALVEMTESA